MVHETLCDQPFADTSKARLSPYPVGAPMARRAAAALTAFTVLFLLGFGATAFGQEKASANQNASAGLVLTRAGICESLENLNPVNTGVVFSVSQGQIYCFSDFGGVRSQTVVYHRWYHRDALTTQIRLKVYPPRWATYSMLKLREVDKGPWKVEITDAEGRVLSVLRFSIVD